MKYASTNIARLSKKIIIHLTHYQKNIKNFKNQKYFHIFKPLFNTFLY